MAACPAPDILVNNNGGPPFRDFRDVDREKLLEGRHAEFRNAPGDDPAGDRRYGGARLWPHRQHHVGIGENAAVRADVSSGARAGLTSFLASVARSAVDRNVTINHILPGMFDTDRIRGGVAARAKMQGVSENEINDAQQSGIPAKRYGQPKEFGQTCAFLCGADAGFITGQSILIDGGAFNSAF